MGFPLLQLIGIQKAFGAVQALKGVSLDLVGGEVHALLGENGAGKSTLIRIITGAHVPDAGQILIHGSLQQSLNTVSAHALGIACIYQQPALFPDLSVMENLSLRLRRPRAWDSMLWETARRTAVDLLARVGAHIDPETEVRHLSMPEQQLVEIACAIGMGAKIMIMDEPTASLGREDQERLFEVVRGLKRSGVGVIYITHRLEEVFALSDRVTVLRDGESLGSHPTQGLEEGELIRWMVGREWTQLFPAKRHREPAPLFSIESVGCESSGVPPVSLKLQAGEVLGLAGLVGAGRTELARVLFGITPAETGTIRVRDQVVTIRSPRDAMNHGIAYVPEDRRRHGVIPDMSVRHNIVASILPRLFPNGWIRQEREASLAMEFRDRLGIKTPDVETPVRMLSGGNQQKVALARWLASKPSVLILDEPTQGVDVGAKGEIHRLIRELADAGTAVLLISSDLQEILGMSDRIVVMRRGHIVAELPGSSSAHEVMVAALGSVPTEGGLST